MSANNCLRIGKRPDGRFYVSCVDMDHGKGYMVRDEGYLTLKEAHEAAEEYLQENEVEYGISIDKNCL